jgi:hypothetical protein
VTPTRATVGAALLGIVVALVVVGSESHPQIASTDRVPNNTFVSDLASGQKICQANEIVPGGTAALRMTIGTYGKPGPRLAIAITAPGSGQDGAKPRLISSARIAEGWKQGVVSLAVSRVARTHADATVCITDAGRWPVAIAGVTPPANFGLNDYIDGSYVGSEVRIDYLLPGHPSWFAMLATLAHRMTLGKGTYVGWMGWMAPLVLMLALVGLLVRVLLREERGGDPPRAARPPRSSAKLARRAVASARRTLARPPRAAYWCALIGMLNALAWGIIVPPFEVPDENAHYAYVQQLAEVRALPHEQSVYTGLSPREDAILAVIHAFEIPGDAANPAPLTEVEQRQLQVVEHEKLSAYGSGDALSAASNPPLYYVLETIPYAISPSHGVLNRLALMRALSAIFAGFTVFFVFMFLRELLPGTRWVWPVGAIAVALQPLFAFISGGVNNDALLYTFAAALFFAVARMFRRGLDEETGVAIGAALGIGLLAKFTLLGVAPGAALAVVCGIWRARRTGRHVALRGAAIAAAFAAIPALLYLTLAKRAVTSGTLGPGGATISVPNVPTGLRGELDHIWQLFLPTIPGLGPNQFSTVQLWHEWFLGLIGRFGWLDTRFPYWVYLVAAPIAIALVLAAIAELARERERTWRHADQLVVYVAMVLGLCVEIGVQSYRSLVTNAGAFEQPRYLLSALCVYAAIVALAARVPGRRWGLVIGALIVMLALAHDVFSQLQAIARYYA